MAPRAYWKGWLKVAAISCPVKLFAATTSTNAPTAMALRHLMLSAVAAALEGVST